MKRLLSAVCGTAFLLAALSGCTQPQDAAVSSAEASEASENTSSAANAASSKTDAEMFTDRDYETDYDEAGSVFIQLDGDSASASSDSVQISGSTVTITEEATYILSGTLEDGMVIVDAPDTAKIQLVLDGASIHSEASAALYVLEADKVFLTLADGSENTLSNGGAFTAIDENNIDGALFSKQDLTLNGTGALTVTSPAGHGIVCKDDLVMTGGTYTITSASHGLDANDSIRIAGGTSLTIDAGKDGLHAENSDDASLGFVYIADGVMMIESEGDGISAGSFMQIENGIFQILAGGGSENGSNDSSDSWGGFMGGARGQHGGASLPAESETEESSTSMKGLKAAGELLISEGSFSIDSADDGIHSNTSITVNGGTFEIASGDDAFHADEALTVAAGLLSITESYEGLEALQIDIQGGEITLTATDDGLNAAGGTDSSGMTGGRDGRFGGGMSSSANGSIVISGGTLSISASGDGIDANGSVEISGGYITVAGPAQGDTAILDYDTSAVITGGTFIGTGASAMAQTFSSSEQGVIAVSTGSQAAGTAVAISDADGNTVLSYVPELSFSAVIFSSPYVITGETYTITAGTASGESEAK